MCPLPAARDAEPADAGLATRLRAVREGIAAAVRRAGRPPGSVRLVVVTKSAPPSLFGDLQRLGVTDAGENRVQGAEQRLAGHEASFRWHFVGHLQANKARRALRLFDVFHGVDSIALLERLDRTAGELGRHPDFLLQVNVSGEASKSGFAPQDLPPALDAGSRLRHGRLVGLMTMAPLHADREAARRVFAGLAALRDEHRARHPALTELSMGMTDDHDLAIGEGATLVRIGRLIIGTGAPAAG